MRGRNRNMKIIKRNGAEATFDISKINKDPADFD